MSENKTNLGGGIPKGTYENAILNAKKIVVRVPSIDNSLSYALDDYYFELDMDYRLLMLVSKDEVDTKLYVYPFESVEAIHFVK